MTARTVRRSVRRGAADAAGAVCNVHDARSACGVAGGGGGVYPRGMGQTQGHRPPIVTLLSDFGLDDWYVASMKASVLRHCPAARLIDITHRVPPGDILCGAISLERAIDGFMPGTVHLAVVDPLVGTERRILVVEIAGQLVVCPDNGLITWAWRRHPGGKVSRLTWRPPVSSYTFHGRDIMGPAAGMLAGGRSPAELAEPIEAPLLLEVEPTVPGATAGRIIHIDHFGNAMTNIGTEVLESRPRAQVAVAGRRLGPVRRTYGDVAPGEPLALVGSSGLLEIAVRDGSAARDLRLRVGDAVELIDPQYSTTALRNLDKQYIWHPFTHMSLWLESDPLVITDAQGMYLIDSDGRRYLDGVSSLWCNVHGHRVPEIDQAIRRQLERFAHSTLLGLAAEPSILLAERLMRIVPANLKKVFYSDSGATATEIAFKMAVQYWYNRGRPEKCQFVAFGDGYHGDTVGAMSVGRMELFHRPYFPLLFKVHFIGEGSGFGVQGSATELRDRRLEELERVLREHAARVAAIAIEPVVQGAAGIRIQPPGFLSEVRRLARQYEVLLIADEVATGFGRTGCMFACEHEAVEPDLMCVAKGLSGGYLPLAATFATQEIFDAFLGAPAEGKTFYHGHTYTGNALACAAAIASLELFERNDLLRQVQHKSRELARMLEELRPLPHVGDVRYKGFMAGIELVEDKATGRKYDPARRMGAAVCDAVRRRGVILRPLGDVIVIMPPLAMGLDDLKTIVDAVRAEVHALCGT